MPAQHENHAQGRGSPAALRSPAGSLTTTGAHACADRKRQRRSLQNALVSALDRALPDRARSKAFKGAGPRSAGIRGRSIFNVLTDCIGWIKQMHLQAACALAATHGTHGRLVEMGRHVYVTPGAVLPYVGGQAPRVATDPGLNMGAAMSTLECLQRRGDHAPTPLPERNSDAPAVAQQQVVPGSRAAIVHSTFESEGGGKSSGVDTLGQSPAQEAPEGGTEVWSRSLSPCGTSWQWRRIWQDPRATSMPQPRFMPPDVLDDSCGAPSAELGGQIDQKPKISAAGAGDANARVDPQILAHFQALHGAHLLYALRDSLGAQCAAALQQPSIQGVSSMPGSSLPLDGHLQGIVTSNAAATWSPVVSTIMHPHASAFRPGSRLSAHNALLHQNLLGISSSASMSMSMVRDSAELGALLTVPPHPHAVLQATQTQT